MATVSQAGSRRMYSWWWDSHISPKNSKWLQENLTDMDSKVKQMIKVIEEDADSFARRAEMYYKKRPELMKLVEEFYRAYRSLAERYDHATGVIRQAHRTMAEAFPNQVPLMLSDESPGSNADADPHTPEMPHPGRALFDPDEQQKDSLRVSPSQFHAAKRNGGFGDDSDSVTSRKGLKQYNDMFGSGEKFADGRARKGLNFHAMEERDRSSQHNGSQDLQAQASLDSDRMGKAEAEISNLKKALAMLESEKEAGLCQYEQSLERLSNLESEVSRAQHNSKDLNERASTAEAEVQNLKEALAKLQAEREASLLQYPQLLDKISNLENSVSSAQKDAQKAETEAEALIEDLDKMKAEKDVALVQYKRSLEMISNLQGKLVQAEEDARQIDERADKAEHELETLKQAFSKLTEEKEAAVVQYMRCLETISNLESKLARAQGEAERLNSEINDGVAKLKGAEEMCLALANSNQTLQLELESLVHKVGSQGEELTEKHKELGRLWTCIQEERLRFMEAETAFQTLQHLHSQSQEELRRLVAELQNRAEILNAMKTRNQGLEDEVQKIGEENKSLNELNLSSALSMKNLQEDILSLRETIKRLEEEVELRVDQRNALQQEIYCLKEELNELSKKNRTMLEQVESVGYDLECFGSSVKELQDEKTKLKQMCETNQVEKAALLEQLQIMEKLLEKNILLENSLADLNDELEGVREKVKVLEESCQILLEEQSNLVAEKTSLISQLQVTNENLEKLSEKNNMLENSLFDTSAELEGLRVKSKSLEDSCLLLDGEKSGLITERESLVSQLNLTQQRLEDLGNRYTSLDDKLSLLQKDRENLLGTVEDLRFQLDAEKKQHDEFCQLSEAQLASRELQICHLQEEGLYRKKEYEEEQDKALNAQIEILVLLQCIQGLGENSFALNTEKQKLLDESVKSKKLVSDMQRENIGQKEDNKSLSEHNNALRLGLYQLLRILDVNESNGFLNKAEQDQSLLDLVITKLKETQESLFSSFDEIHRLVTEKSVLVAILEQVKSDGINLMTARNSIDREYRIQSEQLLTMYAVRHELCQSNEDLKLKLVEGDKREKELVSKTEDLHRLLVDLQSDNENLQKDNIKLLEDKRSLILTVSDLEEQRGCLEEENLAALGETIFHSNMSLVFNDVVSKNLVDLAELTEKLNKLHLDNTDLDEKARGLEEKLEDLRMENVHLKEVLAKSDGELHIVKSFNNQLQTEIIDSKNLLLQKEHDIEQWESQADAFFTDLQISSVCEALLEGKINEILEKCVSLDDESNSKGLEIGLLKQKLGTLEDASGGLQAQLADYTSAVISLKSCIASLEKHTLHEDPSQLEYEEPEDAHLTAQNAETSETGKVQTATQPDGILELQDLQRRIEAIEVAVTEKEQVATMEKLASDTKLDAAMREIADLKARGSSHWENSQTSKHVTASGGQEELGNGLSKNLRVWTRRTKTKEISELDNEVLTKDIVLDQISSDCLSYRRSKRETVEGENHLLELWETVDHDGSIDLTVGKAQKTATVSAKSHKSKNPSVESLIEKELGVDKLEISRRFSEPRREGNKRRVLERLDSDAQKLSNLQITVQDLKRKVEITEKSKKGKGIEYESVKGQLDETEEAITKLFNLNRKLMKNYEDGSQSSSDGMSATALDESGSVRRRKVSEQAKRGSEKIGRLQLEVQRLQFLLLKLDGEEKESRGRFRVPEQKSRVLLRDYLYGGTVRTSRKYKKTPFCSCVQPPTRGD